MRVLDAFSCAGGAAAGYMQAGADVTAVDLDTKALDQNPAQHKVAGDAIEYVREHGHEYDLIHGSPPCQRFTRGNVSTPRVEKWPDLIKPFREACISTGRPYVIENVEQAAGQLVDPMLLCGRMFGLGAPDMHPDAYGMPLILDRHRVFELGGWSMPAPAHLTHKDTTGIGLVWPGEIAGEDRDEFVKSGAGRYLTGQPHVAGVYGKARRDPWEAKYIRHGGYVPANLDTLRHLLGTPWIKTERYLFEAIPPAYTQHIGEAFLSTMAVAA